MKISLSHCLICKPRKNESSPTILISNSLDIYTLSKFVNQIVRGGAKNDVIDIDLCNQIVLLSMFDKQGLIDTSPLRPFSSMKRVNLSYHARGACFKP